MWSLTLTCHRKKEDNFIKHETKTLIHETITIWMNIQFWNTTKILLHATELKRKNNNLNLWPKFYFMQLKQNPNFKCYYFKQSIFLGKEFDFITCNQ